MPNKNAIYNATITFDKENKDYVNQKIHFKSRSMDTRKKHEIIIKGKRIV